MKKQQGVALLVAMLIVAIATIVATQIFYQQQISIRRTLNQLQAEQLYQLALSSEAWAKVMLKEDLNNEDLTKVHVDYLNDNWAQPISLPISEGATVTISIKITDAQSCFNINNLVLNGTTPQPEQIKLLQALMTQHNLNPELVWTLVDWLDADDEPNTYGAEFETYSRLTPAYRTANYRIIELNELYAVSGWDAATINTLLPFICALQPAPKIITAGRFFVHNSEITKINVNTANKEILSALLLPKIGSVNLTTLLEMRKTKAFKSINEFWTQFEKDNPGFWTQLNNNTMKVNDSKVNASKASLTALLTVNSQYFLMEYSALLDQLEQNYRSLIYRPAPATSTAAATAITAQAATTSAAPAESSATAQATTSAPTTTNPSATTQPATAAITSPHNTQTSSTQISILYRSHYY